MATTMETWRHGLPAGLAVLHFTARCALASAVSSPDFVNRFPQFPQVTDYNDIGGSVRLPATVIGNVTGFARSGPAAFTIRCGSDEVRVQFYREDVFRVWLAWGGNFTDPAGDDIVVGTRRAGLHVSLEDRGEYLEMRTKSDVALRAQRRPLLFSMLRGPALVWAEAVGLARNATATFQTLVAEDKEHFFGGGMQNGRFSHRGHRIRLSTDYNWADGGNPNAAPFFLSSSGYGVYRNTWAPGYYDFSLPPIVLAHNESRFDAFYFAAKPRDFKALLEGYTFITGRPFMPPVYGLGLGDSDCYHNDRHGNNTRVVEAVAGKYRELGIPGAWFLLNDGYGCGFGKGPAKFPSDFSLLDNVTAKLKDGYGFVTGLWSSTGLPNISREVNGSQARVFKTDVGWIGDGYKHAFDSVELCVRGIEDNSDARRFVWTVEGWAGTQRLAVMWTGDDSGSFDYIRWQIPTFVGAGFSAQAHVTGDVDGIFGGSPETYVRDLQFKCFTTTIMTMSGWAANPDKQPWAWGEPYTSINREYLKLKGQLTPYFYSLSREAHNTGTPPVRAMALEFPEDSSTFEVHVGSSQQFMAGPWLLVAPVYRPLAETQVRDGIYLPPGLWVDYWLGAVTEGPQTLDGYPAPLDRLPVFVQGGAILPMWPTMLYAGQRPIDPLTLDVYPSGESSFSLYEDDGVTREALEQHAFAVTNLSCVAPLDAMRKGGHIVLSVTASMGSYRGKPLARAYRVQLHLAVPPKGLLLRISGGKRDLPELRSLSALDFAQQGWFHSKTLLGGMLHVKVPSVRTSIGFELELSPEAVQRPPVSEQLAPVEV